MKQLQHRFLNELDFALSEQETDWIKKNHLAPVAQLAIYRGSVQGSLTAILQATFPVCCRLVGEAYFKQLAKAFIEKTPHDQPDMTHYGQSFAAFIETALPKHQLCYLADVAALEWACHLALNGSIVPKLDHVALREVSEAQQANLKFALYQQSTLIYSSYPIWRIWKSNQDDYQGDEQVSLAEGETHLLVHRREKTLCLTPLTEQAFKMLTYFATGNTFLTVCQKCYEEYPTIDIPQLFAECVQCEYLVSFDLPKETTESK